MPIIGPSSYPPTMAEFLLHWSNVLVDPSIAGNFPLPDGTVRADLETLRGELVVFAAAMQDRINDREIARGTIEIAKTALVDRLGEFNRKVRGFLGQTPYANALPDVPGPTLGEAKTLAPLDDVSSLWAKIDTAAIPGFMPPLTLVGGFDRATFDADLAALKAAYQSYNEAVRQLKIDREHRNDKQDRAYAVMRDYRAAVQGTFAPDHALVESLPRLTPAAGSTPDPVTANGQWDLVASEAVLTWNESSNAKLDHYDLRMTPGAEYDTDGDTLIGTAAPGTLEFRTTAGVANPGDTASYKVYVVLTTGNEAGSNTVTIQRPV